MRSSLGWLCRWHWWRLCSTSIIQHLYSASFRILQAEWNKAEKKSRTIWLQFEDRLHSALKNDSIWHLTCGFNLAVALCMFAYRRMENNGALLPEHHAFVMHIFKGIRRIPNGEKKFEQFNGATKVSFCQMIFIAELLSSIYPLGFVLAPAPDWGRRQVQLLVRKTGCSWSLEQYSPTVHFMRTLQFCISWCLDATTGIGINNEVKYKARRHSCFSYFPIGWWSGTLKASATEFLSYHFFFAFRHQPCVDSIVSKWSNNFLKIFKGKTFDFNFLNSMRRTVNAQC